MKPPKNNKTDNILDGITQVAPIVDVILAVNKVPLPFASIISSYFQGFKPFNRNVENYLQYVSESLEDLLQNGIEVQEKIKSEEYLSYLYMSLEGLKKNHQQEKLDMFKKSFHNYWMSPINYDIKTIYVELMTNLSLSHIYILRAIKESSIDTLISVSTKRELHQTLNMNDFSIDIDTFRFLLTDLENKNLINISSSIGDEINVPYSNTLTEGEYNKEKPKIVLTRFAEKFIDYLISN